MKKTTLILAIMTAVVTVIAGAALALKQSNNSQTELSIVATNFPAYDFARAITKGVDGASIKLLIRPGTETHDFEPTPQDIIDIENSDLFIYTSEEAEHWTERIIREESNFHAELFSMQSAIHEVMNEPLDHGHDEHDHDHDHHIWTSLENAQDIIAALEKRISAKDEANRKIYERNAQQYASQIEEVKEIIRNTVTSAKRHTLVFGDRFPLEYFVDEFELSYEAAYEGCEEHSEVSAKRVAELIDYVKKQNIPVVFRIELSDGKIADEIARATGAKVREFHSAHNLSQEDFDEGETYLSLMRQNAEVLMEALN